MEPCVYRLGCSHFHTQGIVVPSILTPCQLTIPAIRSNVNAPRSFLLSESELKLLFSESEFKERRTFMDKQCPKCGVTNPPSRATCQACHTMLGGPITLNPLESAAPTTPRQRVLNKKSPAKIKEPVTQKKRRKSSPLGPATGTRMFILDGNKLRTVFVRVSVAKCKPLESEKRLISLWNRNKGLIK